MGIVIGHVQTLLDAAPAAVVTAAEQMMNGDADARQAWAAVAADRIEDAVLPTCPTLFEHAERTSSGNATDGSVTTIDSTGNVIMTASVPMAAIGVRDLLIVVTPNRSWCVTVPAPIGSTSRSVADSTLGDPAGRVRERR